MVNKHIEGQAQVDLHSIVEEEATEEIQLEVDWTMIAEQILHQVCVSLVSILFVLLLLGL